MKKVLLTGKNTDALNGIREGLSRDFTVQCSELDPAAINDVIDAFKPDAVVLSLNTLRESSKPVLTEILAKHRNIPVITVGTDAEKEMFIQYYKANRLENVLSSAGPDELNKTVERCAAGDNLLDKKAYILVIDDDMSVLHSVKAMLEDEYDVGVAASGAAGLKMMTRRMPDVVLLDYEMPDLDGKQTLERIRGDKASENVPVVFLTGITDREHIDAILGLNPHGYLVKPVDTEHMKKALERVLYYL